MNKTFLIARREYLAFVRTVGFWLSLFTLPLLIGAIILVPLLLRQSSPVQVMSVAVLDLTGEGLESDMRAVVQAHVTPPVSASASGGMQKMAESMMPGDVVRLVDLPAALTPAMTVAQAEEKIPSVLNEAKGPSTVLVAHDEGDTLHFDIWSVQAQAGKLESMIVWDLHGLQYYKLAKMHGIEPALAHDMRESRAKITSLTKRVATSEDTDDDGFSGLLRDNAPRVVGAFMGYIAWMTIFSSSMILLGGVIEEKSSKVLEVLLASTSTESLLIGKVLGVAAVLLTVGAIWSGAGFVLASYGLPLIPPDVLAGLKAGLSGLFSPLHLALLAFYFAGGYLMYGITFSAIGAFCETQKDAQAIMGPMMIVLMIPMLCMQAAFVAPDSPIIRWLSYVPIFTPFLMPLRLAQPLPWWEIVVTLGGMVLVGGFMIMVGRKAFRQGALTGGKLNWGTLFLIATRKPAG